VEDVSAELQLRELVPERPRVVLFGVRVTARVRGRARIRGRARVRALAWAWNAFR